MNFYVIPVAILLALVSAFLFTVIFPGPRPVRNFLVLFFLIFMVAWAGQLWIAPSGPALWGISFLPMLFIIIIVSFLILSFSSPAPYWKTKENKPETNSGVALGIFFWLLVIVLGICIVIGYYRGDAVNRVPIAHSEVEHDVK
jgi:hypothetical protein